MEKILEEEEEEEEDNFPTTALNLPFSVTDSIIISITPPTLGG